MVADVAQILGRRRSRAAVPLLARLAGHASDIVAVAAIEALGRIGGPAGVDPLIAAATSGKFFRVFPAIDVLGRSGDPRAIAPLVALLDGPTYMLETARALGRTGDLAAVDPLVALLASASEATARIAAVALEELAARYQDRYGELEPVQRSIHADATGRRRGAPSGPQPGRRGSGRADRDRLRPRR